MELRALIIFVLENVREFIYIKVNIDVNLQITLSLISFKEANHSFNKGLCYYHISGCV